MAAAIKSLMKVLCLAVCLLLSGCLVLPAPIAAEMSDPEPGESNPFARTVIPAADAAFKAAVLESRSSPAKSHPAPQLTDLPLASGQIVVANQSNPNGYIINLFPAEYWPWTHAGILSLEADGPVIYDIDGQLHPVPGLPPSMFGAGVARRQSFEDFLKTSHVVGIYALPPGVDAQKVVAFARMHYERGTPFDHNYNAEDASALYCAELVARALEAGGAPPIQPVPVRENRSLTKFRQWIPMPSPGLLLPGQFTAPERLLARWGFGFSPAQIDADFETRRELIRRFDSGTRLGLLFGIRDNDPFLREDVVGFLNGTIQRFATFEGDIESIRREVRRLADLYFARSPTEHSAVAGQAPSQP